MADYQCGRDYRVRPMYEFTCQLAALAPPPPDMRRHIGAIAGDQPAMDAHVRMNAGTMSPAEYFAAAERRKAGRAQAGVQSIRPAAVYSFDMLSFQDPTASRTHVRREKEPRVKRWLL